MLQFVDIWGKEHNTWKTKHHISTISFLFFGHQATLHSKETQVYI